jgi:hypothetical protein
MLMAVGSDQLLENTVLTIGDWSHEVPSIRAADSTLFNGKGRYKQKDGKVSDAELAVVNVEKGKSYVLAVCIQGEVLNECSGQISASHLEYWMCTGLQFLHSGSQHDGDCG